MIMAQFHLRDIAHEAALHDRLIQVLDLPEEYGHDLDSLYRILAERGEQTILWVYPDEDTAQLLGDYVDALLDTLQRAAEENPALSICIMDAQE